jgi:hypothetical protein
MGATGSGVSASPGTPPLLGYLGRASTSFSPSTSHSRPSSLGRGLPTNLHGTAAGSPTPPIPETHESGDDNEGAIGPSTSIASSRNIRRYSSSFGQQQQPHQRRATSWLGAGSTTSSGEPGSLVFGASSRGDGSAGESRRTSGRGSMDGFGMRRSSVTSLSRGVSQGVPYFRAVTKLGFVACGTDASGERCDQRLSADARHARPRTRKRRMGPCRIATRITRPNRNRNNTRPTIRLQYKQCGAAQTADKVSDG